MGDIRFLTRDEIAYINDRITRESLVREHLSGMHRVRDPLLLERAVIRPTSSVGGQDAYPTLEDKAAALMDALARYHPFADGNKRTAAVAGALLLAVNGRRVVWDKEEALEQIVALAEGKLDHHEFVAWLATEPTEPALVPDAAQDQQRIEQLISDHRWLLDELAKR